ncbi:MAG: Rossmann-like and DUF2520 domain-containing protein [Gammaproteobacteria bacterium]
MTLPTLNIIGCGRAARTLARLWRNAGVLHVAQVFNRGLESSQEAVDFIGAGEALADLANIRPADFTLIGVPDNQIEAVAGQLAQIRSAKGLKTNGGIAFQLSGSQPSEQLAALRECGMAVASLHPVRSFADPARSAENFAGTYCGLEGDAEASAALGTLVEAIGGMPFNIDPSAKALYHAASVLVCNDLNALMELGLRCYEKAGIHRQTAMTLAGPLVRDTLENILNMGPSEALTGPVVRGDDQVVAGHMAAMSVQMPEVLGAYRELARVNVELAEQRASGDADGIERIRQLLVSMPTPGKPA